MSPGLMRRILPLVLMAILIGFTGGVSERGRNSATFELLSAVTARTAGRRGVSSVSSGESLSPAPANLAPDKSFMFVPSGRTHFRFPVQETIRSPAKCDCALG